MDFSRIDRLIADGFLDDAVRELRILVKTETGNAEAYVKLGQVFCRMGNRDHNNSLYIIAGDYFRRAIEVEPGKEEYHDLLIGAMAQAERLDVLAPEYSKKLAADPQNEILQRCLRKIKTISLMAVDRSSPKKKKTPLILRIIFDMSLLPGGVLAVIISFFGKEYRDQLWIGILTLIIYAGYKVLYSRYTKK